jgi:hypothetical protein
MHDADSPTDCPYIVRPGDAPLLCNRRNCRLALAEPALHLLATNLQTIPVRGREAATVSRPSASRELVPAYQSAGLVTAEPGDRECPRTESVPECLILGDRYLERAGPPAHSGKRFRWFPVPVGPCRHLNIAP